MGKPEAGGSKSHDKDFQHEKSSRETSVFTKELADILGSSCIQLYRRLFERLNDYLSKASTFHLHFTTIFLYLFGNHYY
jgi:hypothetical protein